MSSEPQIIGTKDAKTDRQLRKYKDIMSYRNISVNCKKQLLYRGALVNVYEAAKRRGAGKIPIIHLLDILKKSSTMVDWTESSGLPWCNSNYYTKEDIRNDMAAIKEVIKFWLLLKEGDEATFPDCLVNTSDSPRMWTYPATINFGEAAFVIGLEKAFSEQGDNSIIAYNYVIAGADGRERLRNRFDSKDRFYIKLSFYENGVPAWLIHDIFRMLWTHIDFYRYAGGGRANAVKMFLMLNCIEKYFINTTILLPTGLRIKKSCGIPQGSYFSLLVSSLVSLILLEYLSYRFEGKSTEDKIAYGNESVARIGEYWDLNECERVIKSVFGIALNIPECKVSRNIKCIQLFRIKKSLLM